MFDNVIIIPYRDREKHLEYFIENSVPLIQKYLPNTKILVVEQNIGELFNRGMLLNIGFNEYKNKTIYFFTQDVDINPTIKIINEYYKKAVLQNNVLGIYTSQCNTLGGIIKIMSNTIHKINGFPNNIWGWGAEDKALQNRAEYYDVKKITSLTNKEKHPEYLIRFDDINDRKCDNHSKNHKKYYIDYKKLNNEEKLKDIMDSGLNNLKYNIIERKLLHNIVELIKVDI